MWVELEFLGTGNSEEIEEYYDLVKLLVIIGSEI